MMRARVMRFGPGDSGPFRDGSVDIKIEIDYQLYLSLKYAAISLIA